MSLAPHWPRSEAPRHVTGDPGPRAHTRTYTSRTRRPHRPRPNPWRPSGCRAGPPACWWPAAPPRVRLARAGGRPAAPAGRQVEAPPWRGSVASVPGAGALADRRGAPRLGVSVGRERVPGWRPQVPPRGRAGLSVGRGGGFLRGRVGGAAAPGAGAFRSTWVMSLCPPVCWLALRTPRRVRGWRSLVLGAGNVRGQRTLRPARW